MLDLTQKMETSYKVNRFIKSANDSLNLGLSQPKITYTLKGSKVAEVNCNTINFNKGITNLIDDDIMEQVAYVIDWELNKETSASSSETYTNIIQLLKGNTPVIINIDQNSRVDKKVVTAKKKPNADTSDRKLRAINAYKKAQRANMQITRQEMITVLVEEFDFTNDKAGRIKAAGLYQQAKKFIER